MKKNIIQTAIVAAALLLSSTLGFAIGTQPTVTSEPNVSATVKAPVMKVKGTAQADKGKLVDINSASSAELKKLPGITEEEAAKIIAGRPYGSKAWLVSHNIIDAAVYEGLKQQVIAKQPNKDAAKNAALYTKKK